MLKYFLWLPTKYAFSKMIFFVFGKEYIRVNHGRRTTGASGDENNLPLCWGNENINVLLELKVKALSEWSATILASSPPFKSESLTFKIQCLKFLLTAFKVEKLITLMQMPLVPKFIRSQVFIRQR